MRSVRQTKNSRFISEIPAVSSFVRFQLFPVVGLSARYRSGHRTELAPGFPLFGIEFFLFLLALLADRHKSVHRFLLSGLGIGGPPHTIQLPSGKYKPDLVLFVFRPRKKLEDSVKSLVRSILFV